MENKQNANGLQYKRFSKKNSIKSDAMSSLRHQAEADDPIVQEIPVYLTQQASENIRLLQYPIRAANRSLEQDANEIGEVQDVLYNAEADRLSLKYYLNTRSCHYSNETHSPDLTQFTYSSKAVRQPTNYCVAIIRDGQCFINPIQSIYQMRPDFSHRDPKPDELDSNADPTNTSSLNPFSSGNQNVAHCQIIGSQTENEDLYWNTKGHPTREFIKDKAEFLKKAFSDQSSSPWSKFEDSSKSKSISNDHVPYNDLSQIPPRMPLSDALKLPLNLSVSYYLRECVVLKPSTLFQHLSIDDKKRQKEALKLCLKFGYLVDGRFIVKHEFLRDSPLKHYHKEWLLLIQLFYLNQSRVRRSVFVNIAGSEQIGYGEVQQMLKMMAVRTQIKRTDDGDDNETESKSDSNLNPNSDYRSRCKTGRLHFVWCLKRDNSDSIMLQSEWSGAVQRGRKIMEELVDKSGLRQYNLDDDGHWDLVEESVDEEEIDDVDGDREMEEKIVLNREDKRTRNDSNHNHNHHIRGSKQSFDSEQSPPSPPIKGGQSPKTKRIEKSDAMKVKKERRSIISLTPKSSREKEKKSMEEMKKMEKQKETKVIEKKPKNMDIEMEEKEKENPEKDKMRKGQKYIACQKFMEQKLRKNKVLLRSEVEVLINKYGKKHVVLKDMPSDVLDLVRDDICWVIKEDRYCLKEMEDLETSLDKKKYNECRKKIVDYWNLSRNAKREQISDNTARTQFKDSGLPHKETYKVIMKSVCDLNEEKKWVLKNGHRIKKK